VIFIFLFFNPTGKIHFSRLGNLRFLWFNPRKYTMKTLIIVSVLMFSVGTGLSAVKKTIETGATATAISKHHAQIEALTSN
jgi:hypothetical protein